MAYKPCTPIVDWPAVLWLMRTNNCFYHGIAWCMLSVSLVVCAVNSLLTGGFPYKQSIVRNFVVSFMIFALLVERWCFIKVFNIAGPVCGVSICSHWILLTTDAKRWYILSCLSQRAVEQTAGIQVSRKLTKLIVCNCYVICHSVIDDITGHVCSETTGHQWIPVMRITGVEL